MSQMWLVQLPPSVDDGARVDDASQTAGLRGGVVTEKPLSALGNSRLDCARLDPEDRRHAAAVERTGVLRSMRVGGRTGSGVERYQLHTEGEDGQLQRVSRPWRQFEFIPRQQQGAVVIAQMGSPNLLYTNIPVDGGESGSMVFLFGSHSAAVSAFAVDDLGTTVVSGAEDGSLSVWHVSDGKKVGSISVAHEGGVHAVAIVSPTCVLSAGADGSVRVWQVSADPRLRMLHRMTTGPAPLTSLAVWAAPGSRHRAPEAPLGNLGTSVLKGVSLTEGHQSGSGGAGQLLAAGSADGTVYVWTADPGSPSSVNLNDFGWQPASVSHHLQGMEVSALSFRSDGAALIAAGSEPHHEGTGEVRLFETEHWTSVAMQSYSSGVIACKYTRSALLVDLMLVCSSAGAPRLLEGKLTPSVSAPLREKGMGADVLPQPLGHGPLPPAGNRDGSGIRIVDPTAPLGMTGGGVTLQKVDSVAAADEPRAAPPPTPSAKSPAPVRRSSLAAAPRDATEVSRPKPVLRSAFSRSGKHHTESDATPSERATRMVVQMAADVMAKAPALTPETIPDEEDGGEAADDPDDVLGGVNGAETGLAKPSLMSSRPLLHRNALIPFAVFDKEAELQHHMAPLGVSGRKEAAVVADTHVRAMAAANMDLSLPRNGRRFEGLTQIPKEVPKSARRLVGKQLDPRWLAVRDIKPRMEDMWVAARREPQVCSTEGWNAATLLLPPAEGVEF